MKKYILVLVLHFFVNTFAQPGSMDTSFNPTDVGFGNGDGPNSNVFSAAIQTDGKIIIVGEFSTYNGKARRGIARLNVDGSLDSGFNPGTGANSTVWSVSIQTDGKIIIGGLFTTYNGITRNRIVRLNSDGSLDTTFNPGTGANNIILVTSIQTDGKIIIGGGFTTYNGITINRITRLNADGSLDTSFNTGTGVNSTVRSISIQTDGKIIIGGSFSEYSGTTRNGIARLNADGSLDPGLDPGTGANGAILTTSIQTDGKIIVGGTFTEYNGTTRNKIARLNSDGSLDAALDTAIGANSDVWSTSIQSDGKMIIGGDFTSYNGTTRNRVTRLNIDGSLDTSFDTGTGANGIIFSTPIQTDGKIIIMGFFTNSDATRNHLTRLNSDGSLDSGFNPSTGANRDIFTTSIQPDGKIIIGGWFTVYNNATRNYIARLNIDGSLDSSFNSGTGADNYVWATAVQTDGKIIIGGFFTTYNGITRNRIARLNADGSLDTSFNPGTGANATDFYESIINSISIQTDGKIIISGGFTTYNGITRNRIARLNTDGSLDTGFNSDTGADGTYDRIYSTSIQPDGKIIIGGYFTTYNGTFRKNIARLNADGSLDLSFNPGTGTNSNIFSTSIQTDGKIIIGGFFTTYNDVTRNFIARLNSDASLDTSFNSGTGPNSIINSVSIQPDGKFIIGGYFNSYNGVLRNRIARLNTDSTLDQVFNPGTGASFVNSITLQADGKIIIGGDFTSYNSIGRNRIARINVVTNPPTASAQNFCSGATVANLVATGTALLWYTTINNDSALASTTALATGIYYVSQTLSSIESERTAVSVTVNPLPVVTLGAFSAVCVNAASFNLTGGLPSGGVYSGNGVSSGSFNPSVAGVGTHTITYTYVDGNSCSAFATASIQVNGPFANAGADKTVYIGYAPEKCVMLSGSATGGLAPYTYLWNTGATTAKINVCPTVTTTYSLKVTDARGCFTTDNVVAKAVDITCAKNSVYVCHNNVTICVKTNDVKMHLAHGDYLGTCSNTISVAKNMNTSDIENNDTFLLYPNSTSGSFTVEVCKSDVVEEAKLQVVNIIGQIIYSKNTLKIDGCIKENIELNHALPEGTYFLNLIIGKNIETKKLILEK